MPLFVSGELQHLRELNQLNGAIATASDVSFGPREPLTAEEQATYNKESKRLVSGVSAKYHGSVYIYYDRLALETAFANQLISIEFVGPMTTLYNVLDQLNDKLSTIFTVNDVEDFTFDPTQTSGVFTLTIKEGNAFWHGSVPMGYTVATRTPVVIPDIKLDGVMTPNSETTYEQASLRYAALDFMDSAAWLNSLSLGVLNQANADKLRDILIAMDGTQWVSSGVGPYSVNGATLIYVGQDLNWIVNRQFPNVAVFSLSNDSTLSKGRLYLHFTQPSV